MAVLSAFAVIMGIGLLLGLGLAAADRKLSVSKDEKLESLEAMMPGANCGGCGYAGCSAYANAVYSGEAPIGLCSPGGQELVNRMGEILGVETAAFERVAAYVFCKGNCSNTVREFDYKGLDDCNAAALLFRGANGCKEGCLHLGSCIKVCPEGAISKNKDGDVVVNRELCTGCGRCVKACPNNVIKLIPYEACFAAACNSHQNGAAVRKVCEAGCIGCKICEVKTPQSGFTVTDFLAVSDYKTPYEEAKKAADACPRGIIREVC